MERVELIGIPREEHPMVVFCAKRSELNGGTIFKRVGLEHSVVLENCYLENISRIEDSLIGRNSRIDGTQDNHAALRLFLGNDCQVGV